MKSSQLKTLEDLPKFHVTDVRQAGTTTEGKYLNFEIEGHYDAAMEPRFEQILKGEGPQWFWLLFGERGCITPCLRSFDKSTQTAVLTCDYTEELKVLGLKLAYLSPYWQAYSIWMVLDPNWGWQKNEFEGMDAIAQDYEARDVSIVGGREIRVWTKLEPIGNGSGQSRHYPAADQTLPVNPGTRLAPSAWGHEHCVLCNEHIDAGMVGYINPGDRWMCESCYERYVASRDLAFIDEL